jgi:hypothetical protein
MYHPSEIKEKESELKKLDTASKNLTAAKKAIDGKTAITHTNKAIASVKKDKIKLFKFIEKMKKINKQKKNALFDGKKQNKNKNKKKRKFGK